MQDFIPLAERIVDALLASRPALAAEAGDHRFDDRLPDLSGPAVATDAAMLVDAANALSELDGELLDPAERVDHAVLSALVDRYLFEATEVRSYEWNPLAHNPGALLHVLLARPFAPADERLTSLIGRLRAVPDALATARATLTDMPRIHQETAVGQFAGTAALVRAELPGLLAEAPALRSAAEPAAEAAVRELDAFANWLRQGLRADDGPGRNPRFGRRLWEAQLWHTLDTELSAATVLERAWSNLDRITEEITAAAVELVGGPATPATVRRALDRLAERRPDDDSIVDLAARTLDETTAFVREHDLVSLVDDPCVVMEMPEFARGVAVAYCDPPGELETARLPTFYCIAPTPAQWPADRVESFYREYNYHMVHNVTVHEAMPGHFLQLAHSRRYRGSSRVRAVGRSGPFVEGWAAYAEEMMADAGFGGLPVRMQQLKMQLRTTINAILDQLVHCDELSEAEGMALMTDRGFQEEGESAGKWRRALLTAAQLSTYFVGYTEVAEIAALRPADLSVRRWHDLMLAHGSPAPRHVRALLGLSGGSAALA